MRILGFGGMAAYCIAGCSNQSSNQNIETSAAEVDTHQDEGVNPSDTGTVQVQDTGTVQAQIDEPSVANDDNHQNEGIKPSDNNTVQAQNDELSVADAGNDSKDLNTESKALSDKELDQLLKKYKYKKVNNYTTEIEKKEGMALTFTYIWAESKTGNRIRFPDTFKAIVQGKNGDYYAVFSDGTIDSIANDFFIDLRNDIDYKDCTTRYACAFPKRPYSYVYDERKRKPIGQ